MNKQICSECGCEFVVDNEDDLICGDCLEASHYEENEQYNSEE